MSSLFKSKKVKKMGFNETINNQINQLTLKILADKRKKRIIILESKDPKAQLLKDITKSIATSTKKKVYTIDLSSIISKYIGETEKNLNKLISKAESQDCILFFDEGDELFGKRTDVQDSHDRFANIKTDYLVDRIEKYQGLTILATNSRDKIESVFQKVPQSLLVLNADDTNDEDSGD